MAKNSHYRHGWTPEDRERDFWSKVDKQGPDDCWPWLGYVAPNGYGQYGRRARGATQLAHRIAYEYLIKPVPAGLMLDHLCHTRDVNCPGGPCIHRRCANPAHAEPVRARENIARGRSGDSWGYASDIALRHEQLALPFCRCGSPKPVYKSGKCRPCYRKWLKDPSVKRPSRRTAEDRFWEKVDKRGPVPGQNPGLGRCWAWTASLNQRTHYGQFFPVRGKPMDAHRFSYQLANGLIPEKHDIHHLCFRRSCVNPAHLQALPASLNRAIKMNRRAA